MKRKISLQIPLQFTQLCDLLETTPQQVLQDFLLNLSQEVISSGSDERNMAIEYFMRCGYGMPPYDFEQVQDMFGELDSLRWMWPGNDPAKQAPYRAYRRKYLREWYRDWKALK